MNKDSIQNLIERIDGYVEARDWNQFHTPKNLALAINSEAGELAGHIQWINNSEIFTNPELLDKVKDESADILIYLIRFAGACGFDLIASANTKIDSIDERYPIELSKGNCKKSNEL